MGDSYRPRRPQPRRQSPPSSYSQGRVTPNRTRRSSPGRSAPFRFGDNHESDGRSQFSFRHGDSHRGRFEPRDSGHRGPSSRDDRYRRRDDDGGRRRDYRTGAWPGRRPVLPASARPLVQTERLSTPERLEGMQQGHVRYRSDDELSDTESEPMELDTCGDSDADNRSGPEKDMERPRKKARTTVDSSPVRPQWSNPDPYTILPPEEERGKRRDVVKMIRKAKVKVDGLVDQTDGAVAANNDFISFDFGGDTTSKTGDGEAESVDHSDGTDSDSEDGLVRATDALSANDTPGPARHSSRPGSGDGTSKLVTPSKDKAGQNGAIEGSDGLLPWVDDSKVPPPPATPPPLAPLPPHSPPRTTTSIPAKRKASQITGAIQDEWEAMKGRDDTPWAVVDHTMTANISDWLSMEICDFYEYIKPRSEESSVRANLFDRVDRSLRRMHPDGKTYCFGSYASGLYLPNSDMDLAFVSNEFMRSGEAKFATRQAWMHRLAARLTSDGIASHGSSQVIFHARVPLIKFVDRITGLQVDVSFEQYNGVTAIETFERWKTQYPAMPKLVAVIKMFLLIRGLSEVYLGGIGGFTTICLVVSLLQHHPGVGADQVDPESNIGEMLMNFFDLYGNKFDTMKTGIRMEPPGYFSKEDWFPVRKQDPDRLTILDPNNPDNDISGGSSKIALIQEVFGEAYSQLQTRLYHLETASVRGRRLSRSILGTIIGANYSTLIAQRARMLELSTQTDRPPSPERRIAHPGRRVNRPASRPEYDDRYYSAPSHGRPTRSSGSAGHSGGSSGLAGRISFRNPTAGSSGSGWRR